jgi:hypothetical protein
MDGLVGIGGRRGCAGGGERHAPITNPSHPDVTVFIAIGDIIKCVK